MLVLRGFPHGLVHARAAPSPSSATRFAADPSASSARASCGFEGRVVCWTSPRLRGIGLRFTRRCSSSMTLVLLEVIAWCISRIVASALATSAVEVSLVALDELEPPGAGLDLARAEAERRRRRSSRRRRAERRVRAEDLAVHAEAPPARGPGTAGCRGSLRPSAQDSGVLDDFGEAPREVGGVLGLERGAGASDALGERAAARNDRGEPEQERLVQHERVRFAAPRRDHREVERDGFESRPERTGRATSRAPSAASASISALSSGIDDRPEDVQLDPVLERRGQRRDGLEQDVDALELREVPPVADADLS